MIHSPCPGRWVRAGRCPGDKEQFHVSDLTPGQDYKFRVVAVNDEGDSEPLETEGAIKAKNPYGKQTYCKYARRDDI